MTAAFHDVFYVAAIALLVPMTLALIRAARGPSTYDRISALNSFGTKTVLLIAIVGFVFGRPEWLDLGVVYALMNFIGTLAVLRFSKYGSLATVPNKGPNKGPVKPSASVPPPPSEDAS